MATTTTATPAQINAWKQKTFPNGVPQGYGTGWDPAALAKSENDAALSYANMQAQNNTNAQGADKTKDPGGYVRAQLNKYITDKYGAQQGSVDPNVMNDLVAKLGPDKALAAYQGWADQNKGNMYQASVMSHGTADVDFARQALAQNGDASASTYTPGQGTTTNGGAPPPAQSAPAPAPALSTYSAPPADGGAPPAPAPAQAPPPAPGLPASPATPGSSSLSGAQPAPTSAPTGAPTGTTDVGTGAGNSGTPSPSGANGAAPPTGQGPSGSSSLAGANPNSPGPSGNSDPNQAAKTASMSGPSGAPPSGSSPGGNPAQGVGDATHTATGQAIGGGWGGAGAAPAPTLDTTGAGTSTVSTIPTGASAGGGVGDQGQFGSAAAPPGYTGDEQFNAPAWQGPNGASAQAPTTAQPPAQDTTVAPAPAGATSTAAPTTAQPPAPTSGLQTGAVNPNPTQSVKD